MFYITGALIGFHLIKPFLGLTTSTSTAYTTLITSFKQVPEDLTNTDPKILLNIDDHAFKFVPKERFLATRYNDDVFNALKESMTDVSSEIAHVIGKLLPD